MTKRYIYAMANYDPHSMGWPVLFFISPSFRKSVKAIKKFRAGTSKPEEIKFYRMEVFKDPGYGFWSCRKEIDLRGREISK